MRTVKNSGHHGKACSHRISLSEIEEEIVARPDQRRVREPSRLKALNDSLFRRCEADHVMASIERAEIPGTSRQWRGMSSNPWCPH